MERINCLTVRSELRVGQIEIAYAMDDAYEGSILIGLPDWPGDDSSELADLLMSGRALSSRNFASHGP